MNENEKIEKILKDTPFNSYEDLINSISINKASLAISNSACRQISSIKKPLYSNLGIFLGFFPSLAITIWFAIISKNFLVLFLILLEFILPHFIYICFTLNFKIHYISYISFLIDIFFIKLPNIWILLMLTILFSAWGITFWQKSLYKMSINILKTNKQAFIWAYTSYNLIIYDCYGNSYSPLNSSQNNYIKCKVCEKEISKNNSIDGVCLECHQQILKRLEEKI